MGFYLNFSHLSTGLAEISYKKTESNAFCELCENWLRVGRTFLTSVSKTTKQSDRLRTALRIAPLAALFIPATVTSAVHMYRGDSTCNQHEEANYKPLMTVVIVETKQHPVGVRVAWVVAVGAATFARYCVSCSVYREQIIVVFRVTVSLPEWKCSPFLTDFLVSFVRHAFGFQAKRASNRVDSAFRRGNTFDFYLTDEYVFGHFVFRISPGRRVPLEKHVVSQLVEKFSAVYEIRVFVTVFKTVCHGSFASSNFILVLSHLPLGL